MRRLAAIALLPFALAACKPKDNSPIAGLHSAAAPVLLTLKKGETKALSVGSKLKPSDHIRAEGPAVLEYFGGATKFLDKGDELEVGEAKEAGLVSNTLPEKQLKDGELVELEARTKLMAARYADASFTPLSARKEDPGTTEYLKAFFAPKGMESFLGGGSGPTPDGPRGELPPPPLRAKVPHVHADDLGQGSSYALKVTDEFVAAESDDFATAILVEGSTYDLGRTVRLILPDGAEATLIHKDGKTLSLEGPLDLKLSR